MPKPATLFKKTYNSLLTYALEHLQPGDFFPAEEQLATHCTTSRTTIRSALSHLSQQGLMVNTAWGRKLVRLPLDDDYFGDEELLSRSAHIQDTLMQKVFQSDLPPGYEFSESELAREAKASTVSVREFLIGFARFGLVEKKPRGGWRLCAFDRSYAEELADMRQMLELSGYEKLIQLPPTASIWSHISQLIQSHEALIPQIEQQFTHFPDLDREFHTLFIGQLQNRFAREFYDIVSFVFHYHYQWSKADELERSRQATSEHLLILQALQRKDWQEGKTALLRHLASARSNILRTLLIRENGTT